MLKQTNKFKNILIPNPKRLDRLIAGFTRAGAAKIHVLADFDNTLTKAFVNGKKVPSLLSVLRDNNFLTPDYPAKAKAQFNKFHPMENDANISLKEKKLAMRKWWTLSFRLLLKSGLTKKDIARAVKSENVKFRGGDKKFFKLLHKHNIPLVIISGSGLGLEGINAYLRQTKNLSNNIHVISNSFIWDKTGRAVAVKKPIIHAANKDETEIKYFPAVMKKIKLRTSVILLGDKLEDLHMITGFNYSRLLKIGFLNENVKTNLRLFKKNFDIIILRDGPFDYINQTLKKIV